jgi:hypothetical protein
MEAFAERPAAGTAEQPPVVGVPVIVQVIAQEADKLRRDRDRLECAVATESEAASLAWSAVVGPGTRRPGQGRGERQPPPAGRRPVPP